VSVDFFNIVADDHCVRSFNPGVDLRVTPSAAAIVTSPDPVAKISIDPPIGQASVALVGTVNVAASETFISTTLSL
jgi:hypothetical protein